MPTQTPLDQRPGYSSQARQGFALGARAVIAPRGLFLGSRRVHGSIVRGGTEITLPKGEGGMPPTTRHGEASIWEGIQ